MGNTRQPAGWWPVAFVGIGGVQAMLVGHQETPSHHGLIYELLPSVSTAILPTVLLPVGIFSTTSAAMMAALNVGPVRGFRGR